MTLKTKGQIFLENVVYFKKISNLQGSMQNINENLFRRKLIYEVLWQIILVWLLNFHCLSHFTTSYKNCPLSGASPLAAWGQVNSASKQAAM